MVKIVSTFSVIFSLMLGITTHASITVLNGLTHNHSILPNNTYSGFIKIKNSSNKKQNVKVYLRNYAYNAEGQIFYTQETDSTSHSRSNLKWIRLSTNLLELAPKQEYDLFYEMKVPSILPKDGSYWSVIMVEPVDDIVPKDDKKGVNVTTVIRYAIQIVGTLNKDTATSKLNFIDAKLWAKEKNKYLDISIQNDGELYHKVNLKVAFYDAVTGNEIKVFKGDIFSLLPNNSKKYTTDISAIPLGKYKAVVIADCGDDKVFGINIDVNLTNEK